MSDTQVYEPYIRARLGTAAHLCEVVVLELSRGAFEAAVDAARARAIERGREREIEREKKNFVSTNTAEGFPRGSREAFEAAVDAARARAIQLDQPLLFVDSFMWDT